MNIISVYSRLPKLCILCYILYTVSVKISWTSIDSYIHSSFFDSHEIHHQPPSPPLILEYLNSPVTFHAVQLGLSPHCMREKLSSLSEDESRSTVGRTAKPVSDSWINKLATDKELRWMHYAVYTTHVYVLRLCVRNSQKYIKLTNTNVFTKRKWEGDSVSTHFSRSKFKNFSSTYHSNIANSVDVHEIIFKK